MFDGVVLGKLLTTPSRLLKLVIPLTTLDKNTDRKDVEPLALLGSSLLCLIPAALHSPTISPSTATAVLP